MIEEKDRLYLPHSSSCFVCGSNNDAGLKCRFFTTVDGKVYLYSNLPRNFAGYTNIIHGGIQAAMLDEAMGWCGFTATDSSVFYFTREISLKYRKSVVSEVPFYVQAALTGEKRGLVYAEGSICDENGTVLTSATGSFVPVSSSKMAETSNGLEFINDGRTYFEKAIIICKPKAVDL